jgi:hypothetical protein
MKPELPITMDVILNSRKLLFDLSRDVLQLCEIDKTNLRIRFTYTADKRRQPSNASFTQ